MKYFLWSFFLKGSCWLLVKEFLRKIKSFSDVFYILKTSLKLQIVLKFTLQPAKKCG